MKYQAHVGRHSMLLHGWEKYLHHAYRHLFGQLLHIDITVHTLCQGAPPAGTGHAVTWAPLMEGSNGECE